MSVERIKEVLDTVRQYAAAGSSSGALTNIKAAEQLVDGLIAERDEMRRQRDAGRKAGHCKCGAFEIPPPDPNAHWEGTVCHAIEDCVDHPELVDAYSKTLAASEPAALPRQPQEDGTIERVLAILEEERIEYLANAKRCDAAGKTFGGSLDTHGALVCRNLADRIRALAALPRQGAREERRALENVRLLVASRRKRIDPEIAEHLLRFCAEAGVIGSILRDADDGRCESDLSSTQRCSLPKGHGGGHTYDGILPAAAPSTEQPRIEDCVLCHRPLMTDEMTLVDGRWLCGNTLVCQRLPPAAAPTAGAEEPAPHDLAGDPGPGASGQASLVGTSQDPQASPGGPALSRHPATAACGCVESWPQLIPGHISHGPGCNLPPARERVPAASWRAWVVIDYTNYRGERAERRVFPDHIWYGSDAHHGDSPQWFLRAYSADRREHRNFALKDIHSWKEVPIVLKK